MKLANANKARADIVKRIFDFLSENEDCDMISSNCFNFPIVVNGEDGWAEVTVKIPKGDDDDSLDDGYMKREEYQEKLAEKERKAKERAEAKAKKIERDKKAREEKKMKKEAEKKG